MINVVLIAGIEVAFNVYPAQWWSSLLLQVCHVVILIGLFMSPVPYQQGLELQDLEPTDKKKR